MLKKSCRRVLHQQRRAAKPAAIRSQYDGEKVTAAILQNFFVGRLQIIPFSQNAAG
jgi:hypothetical protein